MEDYKLISNRYTQALLPTPRVGHDLEIAEPSADDSLLVNLDEKLKRTCVHVATQMRAHTGEDDTRARTRRVSLVKQYTKWSRQL